MAKRKKRDKDVARTLQVDDSNDLRARALSAAADKLRRPALVIVMGDDVGRRATVLSASFMIGRSPNADLVLNDPRISSRHCRLDDLGDRWQLTDLASTNGTTLRGERIDEAEVLPNDKIGVGDTVLRFELQDATDRAYDDHLQQMLSIDDLSGLLVRRRFDRELEEMVRTASTAGTPLSLLVMDLDGVKAINDRHGHLMGAFVIGESGKIIGKTIPEGAIAARFGGDEYVVALPGHAAASAFEVGSQIRTAVQEHVFRREDVEVTLGISIGAASLSLSVVDPLTLFSRADEAMYASKRGGRNRVTVHEP